MADSPPAAKNGPEPRFTEAQTVALNEIKSHLNYFQALRPSLDEAADKNDVSAIRRLFESKKITSKRGSKIVTQFSDAFNFTISAVPVEKKTTAGKQKRHQLSIIIQRLMEAERKA